MKTVTINRAPKPKMVPKIIRSVFLPGQEETQDEWKEEDAAMIAAAPLKPPARGDS